MDNAVLDFCLQRPEIAALLGNEGKVQPLTGGLCNDAFVVKGSRASVFVKHCEDHIVAAPHIPLDLARLDSEALAMTLAHSAAPDCVPRLLAADRRHQKLATEFLYDRESLSDALLRGHVHHAMGRQLGSCLARMAAATLPSAMGPTAHGELLRVMRRSAQVSDLMVEYVLHRPFDACDPGNSWPAALAPEVARLVHGNADFAQGLDKMRRVRSDTPVEQQVLIHTDVWAGNILLGSPVSADGRGGGGSNDEGAGQGTTHLIDYEYSTMGPASYDLGHLLSSLLLSTLLVRAYADREDTAAQAAAQAAGSAGAAAAHQQQWQQMQERRRAQEAWLLRSMGEVWAEYVAERRRQASGLSTNAEANALLVDVLGFAGIMTLRWSIGAFNVFKALGLDPQGKEYAQAVRRSVHLGSALLRGRRSVCGTEGLQAMVAAALTADAGCSEMRTEEEEVAGSRCCGGASWRCVANPGAMRDDGMSSLFAAAAEVEFDQRQHLPSLPQQQQAASAAVEGLLSLARRRASVPLTAAAPLPCGLQHRASTEHLMQC